MRGASVTGGSGGVAGTRGGCEGVTGVNRGGAVGGVKLSTTTERQAEVGVWQDQLHVLPLLGATVHHKPILLKLEGQDQDQSHPLVYVCT